MHTLLRYLSAAVLLIAQVGCAMAQDSVPEKRVTFYISYGYLQDDSWVIPLKIWVHEEPDFVRNLAARAARSEIQDRAGLSTLTEEEKDRFEFRTHGFIADSESREHVRFHFPGDPNGTIFELRDADGSSRTDRNGVIEGAVTLSREKARSLLAAQGSADGWLRLRAVSDDHGGAGRVRLIEAEGVSVVSDIDDTVKITGIPSGESVVLNNTFFREFSASPCMAEMYSALGPDVAFHYVSGGPWQMYQPLERFLFGSEGGFPAGSFHMKNVRTNPFESESYEDIWKLIAAGSEQVTFEQKVAQISDLLGHFPRRTFILIGDSGERDPEVFAEIRARYAERIAEIRIRDVVDDRNYNPERLAGMTIILPDAGATGSCEFHAD